MTLTGLVIQWLSLSGYLASHLLSHQLWDSEARSEGIPGSLADLYRLVPAKSIWGHRQALMFKLSHIIYLELSASQQGKKIYLRERV